jgi:hypothetical protein
MADITCPDCGLVTTVPAIRRSADEFCTHCDYPLFWAPTAAPLATATGSSDATLRRLPGVGGRRLIGTDVCPHCGELNPMGTVDCIRCGLPLQPVAEPEPEPEPPPPPAPPPPPEPEPRSWWWLWLIAAVVVAGVATGIILAIVL